MQEDHKEDSDDNGLQYHNQSENVIQSTTIKTIRNIKNRKSISSLLKDKDNNQMQQANNSQSNCNSQFKRSQTNNQDNLPSWSSQAPNEEPASQHDIMYQEMDHSNGMERVLSSKKNKRIIKYKSQIVGQ